VWMALVLFAAEQVWSRRGAATFERA
jgi:hypothetical protein